MINGRKAVGVFLGAITGNLSKSVSKSIYNSARERGYDLFFFNYVGLIGTDYTAYAENEDKLLNVIPFDKFDGFVFNNSVLIMPDMRRKIHEKLLLCKCPAVSIGEPCDDLIQIHFDNAVGIADMVRHFAVHHGFKRIGFMSGPADNPHAIERLEAFRRTMREQRLPENGIGVFHGDFWYNKGEEAADFFFGSCEEKPQAIICANDYMAIALCDALSARGIRCPEDVCISGFDDVEEARTHIPSITTVTRDESRVAAAIFDIFDSYLGKEYQRQAPGQNLLRVIPTDNKYSASCGCGSEESAEPETDVNIASQKVLRMLYHILDTEAGMLEMNRVSEIGQMKDTFERYCLNIGNYRKFFLLCYTDESGRHSYETELAEPTETVYPAVWIDRTGTSVRPKGCLSVKEFIPKDTSAEPYCYYINEVHFEDHAFGYSAIMMESDEPFTDFYNLWIVNIAISLETLLQRNIVRSLVADLEAESTHDRLTGMLNRRGFEKESDRVYSELASDPGAVLTAVMIDMDRLKYINDVFGHRAGDFAISSVGNAILSCCGEGDISGRTGGDEFYVIMPHKDEACAEETVRKIHAVLEKINRSSGKDYDIEVSCGIYSARIGEHSGLEAFLRESDERMYIEKRRKHAERGS